MIPVPPPPDVSDQDQRAAHAAAGRAGVLLSQDAAAWAPPGMPAPVARASFQLLYLAIEMMASSLALLRRSERTFVFAHAASMPLRALADLHGRMLDVWTSDDPERKLRRALADSLRQEMHALDAAEAAGVDVSALRAELRQMASDVGDEAARAAVVSALEQANEYEVLTVYRWESGVAHPGTAALAARWRRGERDEMTYDVAGTPLSLWRVGQLTWATYGAGTRAATHIAWRIGLPLPRFTSEHPTLRPTVRYTAAREKEKGEPPSPEYVRFDFPVWEA